MKVDHRTLPIHGTPEEISVRIRSLGPVQGSITAAILSAGEVRSYAQIDIKSLQKMMNAIIEYKETLREAKGTRKSVVKEVEETPVPVTYFAEDRKRFNDVFKRVTEGKAEPATLLDHIVTVVSRVVQSRK